MRNTLSRRDAVLVLVGASVMHLCNTFFPINPTDSSITISTHLDYPPHADVDPLPPPPDPILRNPYPESDKKVLNLKPDLTPETTTIFAFSTTTATTTEYAPSIATGRSVDLASMVTLPETSIISHAPGWTIFRNLYMSRGTLFIVTSNPSSFPEIRLMTSTGVPASGEPGNEAAREPTIDYMDFISPEEAHRMWGGDLEKREKNRVWSVEGNTLLFNDPSQFLRHYYHFVAELFFGTWAFWTGAFTPPSTDQASAFRLKHPPPPPLNRAIFVHSNADGWRDDPGFNAYFLRAAQPSLTTEHQEDWEDRIAATYTDPERERDRAWHFPIVFLVDRSAAFRGAVCGSRTQRTASEAWEAMSLAGRLPGMAVGGWWEPIRAAVLRFAGAEVVGKGGMDAQVVLGGGGGGGWGADEPGEGVGAEQRLEMPMPDKVVITYISRQAGQRRKLVDADHAGLLFALKELVDRKGAGWELNIMQAESMTKDEQVRAIARTTILLGVHGNGLTHLVLMQPTRISTVIEMFYPGGFAHDYQWTTTALGMKHFVVWNDTHYTSPNEPGVDYPEGFQGNYIPVYGPAVAQLIEDRVEGKL